MQAILLCKDSCPTSIRQASVLIALYSSLDIMGNAVTAVTFSAKLLQHCFAMWYSMTFLAGWYLAMNRMAECTGLVGMSRLAAEQLIIDIRVTAATNFFRLCRWKRDMHRVMRVAMTAQAVRGLQTGTMTVLVMA